MTVGGHRAGCPLMWRVLVNGYRVMKTLIGFAVLTMVAISGAHSASDAQPRDDSVVSAQGVQTH